MADNPLVFNDLEIGEEFCWDHRRNMVDGWCAGAEHGLLKKVSVTSYGYADRPRDERSLWTGGDQWPVRRGTDECGGVSLCQRCKAPLYYEVRRQLFTKIEFCDDCVEKRADETKAAAERAKHHRFLRRVVDVVWQAVTESEAVPSTEWADRLIARAQREDAEDPDEDPYDAPPQRPAGSKRLYDPWGNEDPQQPRWHCRCNRANMPAGFDHCDRCKKPRSECEESRADHDPATGRYLRTVPVIRQKEES